MRRLTVVLMMLLMIAGCLAPAESDFVKGDSGWNDTFVQGTVRNIVDGDTFDVIVMRTDGTAYEKRVRPILIDAPEICHQHSPESCAPEPFGPEATDFAEERLLGETVYLEEDQNPLDPFDRYLYYVYTEDGAMFQEELLAQGLAEVAVYDDIRYMDRFFEIQEEAQRLGMGMWD